MTEKEKQRLSESLEILQSLRRHEGYIWLMNMIDEKSKYTFSLISSASDPTPLAKGVGALTALREIRARVDSEIDSTVKLLQGDVEE